MKKTEECIYVGACHACGSTAKLIIYLMVLEEIKKQTFNHAVNTIFEQNEERIEAQYMAKEEAIRVEGQVIDVLPNAMFRIKVNEKSNILGHISGKMRQNDIKVLLGDIVEMEMSPYDLTKGRITRRK